MINYKEYYIAFLDILGFSSKIGKEDATIIHGIFTRIKALKRMTRGTAFDGHAATELEQNTKFLFFSDTIVCAIPTSIYGAFEALTSHCMMIQHYLYSEESPVLLRGAIVKGEMYINGSEMFGPGLIDAYRMEESLAIYPRIIMTRGTYEDGIAQSNGGEEIMYVCDTDDGLKMVETLKYFDYSPELARLKNLIEMKIATEQNARVREKYLWLRTHFNLCVNKGSRVPEFREPIK